MNNNYVIIHSGVKGQRWGRRRFQNEDGTLTPEGILRYRQELANQNKNRDLQRETTRMRRDNALQRKTEIANAKAYAIRKNADTRPSRDSVAAGTRQHRMSQLVESLKSDNSRKIAYRQSADQLKGVKKQSTDQVAIAKQQSRDQLEAAKQQSRDQRKETAITAKSDAKQSRDRLNEVRAKANADKKQSNDQVKIAKIQSKTQLKSIKAYEKKEQKAMKAERKADEERTEQKSRLLKVGVAAITGLAVTGFSLYSKYAKNKAKLGKKSVANNLARNAMLKKNKGWAKGIRDFTKRFDNVKF